MIEGLGLDLVEVARIQRSVERWGRRFLSRVFTQREIEYCFQQGEGYRSLAARFAAKEAVFKALGKGWPQGGDWKDVEVLGQRGSRPEVMLHGRTKQIVDKGRVLVCLSHTSEYAAAVAAFQDGLVLGPSG